MFPRPPGPVTRPSRSTGAPIIAKVTATGTLSALVTVQVGTQVSGRIKEIDVDFNSPVKKGQVIAKIEPALFAAALESARANTLAGQGTVTKLEAQAENAKLQRERAEALFERKAIAQADLDTAARHPCAPAEGDRGRGARQPGAGQGVAPPGPGEPGLHDDRVADRRRRHLAQRGRRADGGGLAAGADAVPDRRGPDARCRSTPAWPRPTSASSAAAWRRPSPSTRFPTERFKGKVRQIRNAPQTLQNVVTYDAVIDVDNADLKLRPGMTANVDLRLRRAAATVRCGSPTRRCASSRRRSWRAARGRTGAPPGRVARGPAGGQRRRAPGTRRARESRTGGRSGCLRGRSRRPCACTIGVTDGTITEIDDRPELHEGDAVVTDAEHQRRRQGPAGGPERLPADVLDDGRLGTLSHDLRSSSSKDVTKVYQMGDVEVRALRGVTLSRRRGRVRGGDGLVGLGQVDADEHPRLPRPADRRRVTSSTARTSPGSTRDGAGARSATARSGSCSRASTCCRARARSRTSSCRCSTPDVPRDGAAPAGAPRRWSGSGSATACDHHPEPAVGRAAAARRDRARARDRAEGDPGRRADRQPRLADQHRGDGAVPGAVGEPASPSCWSPTSPTSPASPGAWSS